MSSARPRGFAYELLTAENRVTLLRDRLRRLEADHFKLELELRLADTVGEAELLNPSYQVALATLEAKAAALRAWLGHEPSDRLVAPLATEECDPVNSSIADTANA